jgi:hypothetical protein
LKYLTQVWEIIKDAIATFGLLKGTFALFFWVAHYWIYRLYAGRLQDRQREIDKVAAENREYRDRFMTLLDIKFGLRDDKEAAKPKTEGEKSELPPKPDDPELEKE